MSQTDSAKPVFEYDGKLSELFGIYLLNLLLTIVTLGIYRFWAITRIRRYLWSHVRFERTRFTYTGKGKELFLGFFLAMTILGLAFSAFGLISAELAKVNQTLAIAVGALAYIPMFILFGAAHFSAQRYRLSRTEWLGLRGGMEGSAVRYGVASFLYTLGMIVTLFQIIPWMQVGLARRRINATRFGSAALRFEGRAGRLYWSWLGTLVGYVVLAAAVVGVVYAIEWANLQPLFAGKSHGARSQMALRHAIPTFVIAILVFSVLAGLLATWYWARLARLLMGNTTVILPGTDPAAAPRFQSTVSAAGLLWLFTSNALIALLTLGLGMPIVLHRSIRYLVQTTMLTGHVDANMLVQSTQAKPRFGEGFLQALDPGIV